MLKAILAVAVILTAVIGWGLLIERYLWRDESVQLPLAERGLLGLAGIALTGLLLNFIRPLESWVATIVVVVGLIVVVRRRRDLGYRLVHLSPGQSLLVVLFIVVASALGSYSGRLVHDSSFYHLQAILWQGDAPAVLGLANLLGQLGFNSSWLTVAAVFNGWPFGLAGAFAVNAVLTSLILLGLFELAWQRNRAALIDQWPRVLAVVTAGFLCLTASKYLFKFSGSPTTDVPGALLTVYLFVLTITLLPRRTPGIDLGPIIPYPYIALLGVLAVFAVTIKLSQAPVLLLPLGLLAMTGMTREFWWNARSAVYFAGALFIAWLARGVWTSGCLFYPNDATCFFDLPWAVSDKQAIGDLVAVKAWARAPGVTPFVDVLTNWMWLREWVHRFLGNSIVQYLLAVNAVAFGYWVWRRSRGSMHSVIAETATIRGVQGMFIWTAIALVFWFATAPDPRFGYGYLIAFGMLCFSILIRYRGAILDSPSGMRSLLIGSVGLLVVNSGYTLIRIADERDLGWDWPVIPPSVMSTQYNYQGKPFYSGRHWDECSVLPRPCTPYFDPKLTMTQVGPWIMFNGGHKYDSLQGKSSVRHE